MIVFEVLLNGRKIARAGTDDMGVLTTHVTGVGKLGRRSTGTKTMQGGYDLDLHIGGLTSRVRRPDEHLRWGPRRNLKVGDEVAVRILEASKADAPSRQYPREGDTKKPSDRERYEFAKTLYFKLRDKFERRRLTARSSATRRKRRAHKRGS